MEVTDHVLGRIEEHDATLKTFRTLDIAGAREQAQRAEAWTTATASYTPHGTFAPVYTSHTHMFNWLGFPAASVPCGFVDGLPVGLQIVGRPGNEATIFQVAPAYQTAFPQLERPPVS